MQVPIYQQQVGGTNGGLQFDGYADPGQMRTPLDHTIGDGLSKLSGWAKKYQDDLDETMVADRLADLRRFAQEQRTGDDGYLKLHGENAMAKDSDGWGLPERVDRQIKDYGASLGEGLTQRQRLAFQKGAANIYTQQYAFSTQHLITESDNYMKGRAEGRITNATQIMLANVGNPDVLKECLEGIARDQAIINRRGGVSADEAEASIRKAQGGAVYSVITSVMQQSGDPITANAQAAALFGEYKHLFTPEQLASVTMMRNKNQDAIIVKTSGEAAFNALRKERGVIQNLFSLGVMGKTNLSAVDIATSSAAFHTGVIVPIESGGRQFEERSDGKVGALTGRRADGSLPAEHERAYGVSQMQIGTAKEVAERHGIEWNATQFQTDRFYNKQLGELLLGDLMTTYDGDIYKAFAAYHSGQGNVNDAVAAATKAGDPSRWVEYLGPAGRAYVAKCQKQIEMLQNPKVLNSSKQKVNYFEGDYAESSYQSIKRSEIKKFLAETNPSLYGKANSWRLEQATDEAEKVQAQDKADYVRGQENTKNQIVDMIYQGASEDDLRQSGLWQKLNVNEQMAVSAVLNKLRKHDTTGSEALANRYINDPELWMKQPEEKMRSLLLLMPKDKAAQLYDHWYKANVGAGVAENNANYKRLQSELGIYQSEFDSTPEAIRGAFRYADPKWWNGLDKNVQDQIVADAARTANSLGALRGKKLATSEELRMNGFNDYVRHQYKVAGLFFDSDKTVFELTVSDLPNANKSDAYGIIESLTKKRVGREDVSDDEMTTTLRDVFLNPNSQVKWSDLTIDEQTVKALRKEYPGVGNGLDLLRYYLRDRIADRLSGEKYFPKANRIDPMMLTGESVEAPTWGSYGDYKTDDYTKQ